MLASNQLDWPCRALKDHAEISFPVAEEIPAHSLEPTQGHCHDWSLYALEEPGWAEMRHYTFTVFSKSSCFLKCSFQCPVGLCPGRFDQASAAVICPRGMLFSKLTTWEAKKVNLNLASASAFNKQKDLPLPIPSVRFSFCLANHASVNLPSVAWAIFPLLRQACKQLGKISF